LFERKFPIHAQEPVGIVLYRTVAEAYPKYSFN